MASDPVTPESAIVALQKEGTRYQENRVADAAWNETLGIRVTPTVIDLVNMLGRPSNETVREYANVISAPCEARVGDSG